MRIVKHKDLLNHHVSKQPHVFLLGAGASLAALPQGDLNGNKLPLMYDLLTVTGLGKVLDEHIDLGLYPKDNFELFYNKVLDEVPAVAKTIEGHIRNYFSNMKLPEIPTLYDYLVLSLREKDVIATFNWDPFLWQAVMRNRHMTGMPQTVFLHGSVAVGFDAKNNIMGPVLDYSSKGELFEPVDLLYPINKKNYQISSFISTAWNSFQSYLSKALIFTIYGYNAPDSDVEAVNLLQKAWGTPEQRDIEEVEIIDIKTDDELASKWGSFIHTHHYGVSNDLFSTFVGKYPRRSCEAFCCQNLGAMYLDDDVRLVKHETLDEMWRWFEPIISQENK